MKCPDCGDRLVLEDVKCPGCGVEVLVFDPDNLEASCKMLRARFKGIKLPRSNKLLVKYVLECYGIIQEQKRKAGTGRQS
jgi:hypothetical protein